jgi:small nuclear ribonucleoprotein (snRNP)-like protein
VSALLVAGVLGANLFGVGVLLAQRRRLAPLPKPLDALGELVRDRVIVHTKDDRAIRGVLLEAYPDCVVIDAPEYLVEPEVQILKGRALIERSNVAWIQVLSAGDDDGS